MLEQSSRPCLTCGRTDRYPSGPCRTCHREQQARYLARLSTGQVVNDRPCLACGGTVRNQYGKCYACVRRRQLAWDKRKRENPTAVRHYAEPRRCNVCQRDLPLTAFKTTTDNRLTTYCRDCTNEGNMARYQRYRLECLRHYSGDIPRCACCGEGTLTFLAIDHINNDGAAHRKVLRSNAITNWLAKNGFPDGFQVLCYNCNIGKYRNGGVCPHVSAAKAESAAPCEHTYSQMAMF